MTGLRAPARYRLQPFARLSSQISSVSLRSQRLYASSSYGSGEGDPKGENPQDQGSNPSSSREHPGPPAPDVSKPGSKTEEPSSKTGGAAKHSTDQSKSDRPQPKIYSASIPSEPSEDVRKHNEELAQRHDRPNAEVDTKGETVEKGFWKVLTTRLDQADKRSRIAGFWRSGPQSLMHHILLQPCNYRICGSLFVTKAH